MSLEGELIELRAFRQSATATIEMLTEAAAEAHQDIEALRAAVRALLPLARTMAALHLFERPLAAFEAMGAVLAAESLLDKASR